MAINLEHFHTIIIWGTDVLINLIMGLISYCIGRKIITSCILNMLLFSLPLYFNNFEKIYFFKNKKWLLFACYYYFESKFTKTVNLYCYFQNFWGS